MGGRGPAVLRRPVASATRRPARAPAGSVGAGIELRESGTRFLYYDSKVDMHPSAREHGIADQDIDHDDQDGDTRLYLGPTCDAGASRGRHARLGGRDRACDPRAEDAVEVSPTSVWWRLS